MASILARSGSAPRAAGTKMIVRSNGAIIGSIGGGVLEARVLSAAGEVIRTGNPFTRRFSLTAEDVDRLGMICGGEVEVRVDFMDSADAGRLALYQNVAAAIRAREAAWLITQAPHPEETLGQWRECLLTLDGRITSAHSTCCDPRGFRDPFIILEAVKRAGAESRVTFVTIEGERFAAERLSGVSEVLIFGAGHVARSLAVLTKMVGFRTVVIDDREEFANRHRFDTADEIIVLNSFEHLPREMEITRGSYIVIVTRGHSRDAIVLESVLKAEAAYIGMIGSRRKRDEIFEALSGKGFVVEDLLERVHSPIGIGIGAETPEEIAVSIVAELIAARAGNKS